MNITATSQNPSLLIPTITIWNYNQKLRSKGFSTILKKSEVEGLEPESEIEIIGQSQVNGKTKAVRMLCKVICAVVEPFEVISHNKWLVHEFIGAYGTESQRLMSSAFPNVKPDEPMIAIRLQFLKVIP